MKVSIQQDMPHDEFVNRFGPIVGAGFDEAHAALLRAQGIKPVNVETVYGSGSQQQAVAANAVALIPASPQPTGEVAATVDLSPLYGIFIQLADALTETRQRLEERTVAQEKVNQGLVVRMDALERRLSTFEEVIGALADEAERRLNASAA